MPFTSATVVAPGIKVYHNAIPQEWDLINRFERALNSGESDFLKWSKAKVGYGEEINDHRNCQDFKYRASEIRETTPFSEDAKEMHRLIEQSLKDCLVDYGNEFGVHIEYIEAVNVVKYGPGEFFNVHSDDGEPYRCTVSAVGYINDDYEGGELWYKFFDYTYKPKAGDFVVFPSSYVYAHAALPVKDGTKYSLVIMTDRNEFAHVKDSPSYHR